MVFVSHDPTIGQMFDNHVRLAELSKLRGETSAKSFFIARRRVAQFALPFQRRCTNRRFSSDYLCFARC